MPGGLGGVDRRFAAVVSGQQMIVTDQVQQTAIDLKTGAIGWRQKKPAPPAPPEEPDKKAARQAKQAKEKEKEKDKKPPPPADFRWSLAAMTPTVDRQRIYVRRLSDQQSELVCLDAASGKPVWSGEAAGSAISNVLLIGQNLFAITARQPFNGQLDVALVGFDPGTGQVRSQAALADFHDYCNRVLHCRAVAVADKVIASLGGTVICAELPGRVRWLRRQLFAPPPYAASPDEAKRSLLWHQQMPSPPLVSDGRVYVTQPGVWAVECLNVDNGRLIWRQPLPEITALAGRIEKRLIVGTTGGLLALDTETGKVLWRRDISYRLDPIVCGRPGGILCVRLEVPDDEDPLTRPVLVWLDPQSGDVLRQCALDPPTPDAELCAPIVAHGDRQWAIFTVPGQPAVRQIVELIPVKDVGKAPSP